MAKHQVVIIGGGAAVFATATNLYKRDSSIEIAIVEPSTHYYYQPPYTWERDV